MIHRFTVPESRQTNLHMVLDYGAIVASDSECDLLITVNGSYFNLWVGNFEGRYECTDCMYGGFGGDQSSRGLYAKDESTQIVEIMYRAEAWRERIKAGDEEE